MSTLVNEGVEPNVETMKATAKALGIKMPRGRAKPETIVAALREGFAERLKSVSKEDWIKCPVCGEITDDDGAIEVCPFCGDEGVEDEDGAVEASELDGDIGEAEEPPTADLGDDEDEEPTDEDEEPTDEEPGTDLAKGKEAMLAALTQEKTIIRAEQSKLVGASYDLGLSIRRVREGNLWKAEGHKTFRAFCESMGISHTLAYGLIDLTTKFDRDTYLEVGRKKLSIVARADKEDREELLEDAKKGKSVRALDKKARERKEKRGKAKVDKEESATDPNAPKPGRPKKEDQTIVLMTKVGGKAKSYPFHDRQTREELKEWKADAYAQIQLSSDVFLLLVLKTNKEGKPVAVHATYRRATTTETEVEDTPAAAE